RRIAPRRAAKVDSQSLGAGHQHRRTPHHPALDGDLLPPLRNDVVEDTPVDHAAIDVLGAWERAAFDDHYVAPCTRKSERRRRSGWAGTNHHDVEIRGHRPASASSAAVGTPTRDASSTRSSRASVTRPRFAMDVIGHDGSTLTLTMW